jgi:hypothetical protein
MKPLFFALPILLLSACVSIGGFDRLEPGAPREQVLRAMEGCPSTTQKAGRYEAFVFNDRMPRFFQWAPGTYTFILRDGVLVEFGEGTPRQQGTAEEPTLVLVRPVAT